MVCLYVHTDPYTKSSKTPTIIGAVMGGIAVVVLMIALFFILKLRKSVKMMREIQNGKYVDLFIFCENHLLYF